MALRRLGKDIIRDKRFGLKKEPPEGRTNLHLDAYFHMRSGFEAFRERYYKG